VKKVSLALIGAGQRGMDSYGMYALHRPDDVQFVAVAEANSDRREKFCAAHGIPEERCFSDWRDLLAQPRLADGLLVCTQDRAHFAPTIAALEAGYHVMLEKPMSPDPAECLEMAAAAIRLEKIQPVCHVLGYTTFFAAIKRLLDDGRIGRLISIQHNENVAFSHYAHSYVRGNWRHTRQSSPMILAKSCHDMDILLWLAGADCVAQSSFGSLTHFRPENAPAGAPDRCLDGCPSADACAYYAPRFYLTAADVWPASVISDDTSHEALLSALREGPYGRCVYRSDNDVVDHQVVNLEFANGVTAVFTMCAFTDDVSRTIKLMGTDGEIRGVISRERNELEVLHFPSRSREVLTLESEGGPQGHGGGDFGVMRAFAALVRDNDWRNVSTSAAASAQGHSMAFAAEASRLERRTISIPDFHEGLRPEPSAPVLDDLPKG
jgi:predicted dehydrogenase